MMHPGNLANRPPLGLKGAKPRRSPGVSAAPLRQAAKGQTCTLRLPCCVGGTETVVLAHLRFFGWAGIAQKPDDLLAVFACHACHDALDRRNATTSGLWGFEDVLRALGETLLRQKAQGNIVVGGPGK